MQSGQLISNTYSINDRFLNFQHDMEFNNPTINSNIFYDNVLCSSPSVLYSSIYMSPNEDSMRNPSYMDNIDNAFNAPYMEFQPNNYDNYNNSMYGHGNAGNNVISIEKDSYFNTINSTNKDIDYKNFSNINQSKIKKKKYVKKEVKKILNSNRDFVNIFIMLMLIFIIVYFR